MSSNQGPNKPRKSSSLEPESVTLARAFFQYTAWAVSRTPDLEAAVRDVVSLVGPRETLVSVVRLIVEADQYLTDVAPTIMELVRTGKAPSHAAGSEPDDLDEFDRRPDRSVRPYWTVRRGVGNGLFDLPMLTPLEFGRLLGAPDEGAIETALAARRRSGVLALPYRDSLLYPLFQVDEPRHRVWPVVRKANRELYALLDPWGAALFWSEPDPKTGIERHALVGNRTTDRRLPLDASGWLMRWGERTLDHQARASQGPRHRG
jgi:hypothetical protein